MTTSSSSSFTFTPDPHLLSPLKALAKGTLCSNDVGDSCLYCSYAGPFTDLEAGDDPAHDTDCPIVLARQLLRTWGLSLCVYCISYERGRVQRNHQKGWDIVDWSPLTWYTVAFEEEEARDEFLGWADSRPLRHIQVTALREILPPLPQESPEPGSEEGKPS